MYRDRGDVSAQWSDLVGNSERQRSMNLTITMPPAAPNLPSSISAAHLAVFLNCHCFHEARRMPHLTLAVLIWASSSVAVCDAAHGIRKV
jgi:hypothetical protein